jgi:hypothetical protein
VRVCTEVYSHKGGPKQPAGLSTSGIDNPVLDSHNVYATDATTQTKKYGLPDVIRSSLRDGAVKRPTFCCHSYIVDCQYVPLHRRCSGADDDVLVRNPVDLFSRSKLTSAVGVTESTPNLGG